MRQALEREQDMLKNAKIQSSFYIHWNSRVTWTTQDQMERGDTVEIFGSYRNKIGECVESS
jgi:hypothetical protein